ncbi:MAG: hypothetical protein E6I89_03225 [Chloroflexi bacterium]|nr:MAG: hypothetical protein E6I89_03225 [Chloroflexota bacterium]
MLIWSPILPAVDSTAPAILELGLLLLLAALAGKAARALGLPAVIGYLAVGLLVSPFTPGYVANREQLSILADVGVVLLLFEVGIEINPLRLAREARRLLVLSPLQVLITWVLSTAGCLALGLAPAGAALIGLSIAMSSSVVVVNITRSRRRTTDQRTDEVLLGWSVLQDLVGVSAALILVVVIGVGGRSGLAAVAGVIAFVALAAAAAFLVPWLLARLRTEHDLFLLVSVASGRGRGAAAPAAVPRSLRGDVLRRARRRNRPRAAAPGTAVAVRIPRHGRAGQGAGGLDHGETGQAGRSTAPAGDRPRPGRRVQLRARGDRPGSRVDQRPGERGPGGSGRGVDRRLVDPGAGGPSVQ